MKEWWPTSGATRKAKMDEMETLDFEGWHFLCGGEQLPSGAFQATVRLRNLGLMDQGWH
jgi:hypothetical protein